jgi:exopolysaccharide biosynthesis polyprenyl glycosylphosphotransferase
VVLAQPGLSSERVLRVLYECEKEMVAFRWIADIFGLITAKMQVSYLGTVPILSFTDSPLNDWENRVLKRTMDIVLSASALVALSPLYLLLAVLVKMDSKGPIFFFQERLGEDGRQFKLIKFRTMKTDAESKTGPVWAKEEDDRRTRLGTSLRKTNLDELPQFWNVLAGDMSLVGPRPERPFFASQFKEDIPRYMARHSIRSGITGWAQVNGLRGNTSIEERTKYDLYYIENWSLVLDIKILFMTLWARRNAY